MKMPLTPNEQKVLTFQQYGPQPEIDGVSYTPLKKHAALEGWFMEYVRLSGGKIEGLPGGFDVRQVSFSRAVPSRINAFHVHPKQAQDEVWCVVDGTMLVWLVDTRAGSPTAGNKRRYVLSADAPGLLYIPTGVAHGYKAGATGALLVYAMNSQFNLADPNEGRLPWDHFGAELWKTIVAELERILISGGAGFIGSNFVRYALARYPRCRPVVLDKMTYAGNWDNLSDLADRITFIQGDIAEASDVAGAMAGADAVVNFAAESHVDRSLVNSHPFVRTNVEGTLVLLESAVREKVQRFLHISTDEVYGDLAGTDVHSIETDTLAPRSPYAATKAAAEHLVFSYGISYGLNVVVTRGSNTYGPYQYPEKIIPLFITNAIEDKPLPLYGNGSAVRDYMHVEDHCAGVDFVLQNGQPGQAYNLGARYEISGVEVADRILALLGKPASLKKFVADRPGHDYRYSVDTQKAESLGWRRRHSWEEGLAATVEWYRTNEAWWRSAKHRLEFRQHEKNWYQDRK